MYHRVADEVLDPWALCVSPPNFDQQVAAIRSAGSGVALDHYMKRLGSSRGSPRLALTFDDGYRDNVSQALPVLERHDVPATIFVVSDVLGSGREFWWDTLARCILAESALVDPLVIDLGRGPETFPLSDPADGKGEGDAPTPAWRADDEPPRTQRQRLFLELWTRLVVMRDDARRRILDELVSLAGVASAPDPERLPIAADDVARLAAHPLIEIGAHTMSHASLTDLDPTDQHAEIAGSKQALEGIIGKPVRFFSYPYGRFNDVSLAIVREAGFAIACTSRPAAATAFSARHALPRLQVMDDDGPAFIRKLHQDVRPGAD